MRIHRSLAVLLPVLCLRGVGAQSPTREPNEGPGPRKGHVMVYATHLERVLMVDASPASLPGPRHQEVWSWDGDQWSRLSDTAATLAGNTTFGATYDSKRFRVVMVGGRTGPMTQNDVVGGTWESDGKRWFGTTDSLPGARDHLALAFDASRGRTVMFGGAVFPRVVGEWAHDTWEWDGARWARAAVTGPEGRISSLGYDSKRREVLMFGGHGAGQPARYLGDTWLWNGTHWREAAGGPPPRSGHAVAFDARNGVMLLHGGGGRVEGVFREFDDFWQWDGSSWSRIEAAEPSPGPRVGHAMAYDERRGRIVLHGGSRGRTMLDDTWEWDGHRWYRIR